MSCSLPCCLFPFPPACVPPPLQVSITDGMSGETVRSFALNGDPCDICVSDRKDDGYSKHDENTYSLNVGRKTLYIMQVRWAVSGRGGGCRGGGRRAGLCRRWGERQEGRAWVGTEGGAGGCRGKPSTGSLHEQVGV